MLTEQSVLGCEAGIQRLEKHELPKEQSARDKHDDAERHFGADEQSPQHMTRPAGNRSRASAEQGSLNVDAARLPGREQAEQNAGETRQSEADRNRSGIERDASPLGKRRPAYGFERFEAGVGDQHARRAADDRDDEALDHQLTDHREAATPNAMRVATSLPRLTRERSTAPRY